MKSITKTKPRVYLAGKIGHYDWRHKIVPGLREAGAGAGHYPPPYECRTFIYMGPFFECDDHSGSHGPGCHGNCDRYGWLSKPPICKGSLFARNNLAIKESDILFAYIETYDCIGTICEISYAWTLDKPIYITYKPGIDQNEFWYLREMATIVTPREVAAIDLPTVFSERLSSWRTRQ